MHAQSVTLRFNRASAPCKFHFFVDTTTSILPVLVLLDDGMDNTYSLTNAADLLGYAIPNELEVSISTACCYEDTDGFFSMLSFNPDGSLRKVVPILAEGEPVTDIRVAITQTAQFHALDDMDTSREH